MELEALSGAATVAMISTVIFVLIAKTWNVVQRSIGSVPNFSDSMMHEAAQRFRDELDRLTSSQSTYLGGVLVFVMLFVVAYLLQAKDLFAGYPSWHLNLQLGFLLLVFSFAVYSLTKTARRRHQMKFLRDANVAIGHRLQQVCTGGTHVFHDVATSAGTVDHLVVGQKGLYAVNVVARRNSAPAPARLRGDNIQYSNSKVVHSIVRVKAKTIRLQKDFQELLGHAVRIRSVIAIPGWKVAEQSSDEHLLVNEWNVAMLSGWKDPKDSLMNEDIAALQKELVSRCARGKTKSG